MPSKREGLCARDAVALVDLQMHAWRKLFLCGELNVLKKMNVVIIECDK